MEKLRLFIIAHPILAASLSSVWGAVVVDLFAFKGAKDPGDWWTQFSLKVAAWRYLQALVGGFIGNALVAGAASAVALGTAWLWFR